MDRSLHRLRRQAVLTAPVLAAHLGGQQIRRQEGTRTEDLLSSGVQLSSTSYYAAVLSQK